MTESSNESTVVELENPFVDARGIIQPLLGMPVHDVALITSKKGAVRANHYHKTDWHYCYVLRGSLEYLHRPVGSNQPPAVQVIAAGQLFFTPAMLEHAMRFLEDTQFIVMSGNPRDHETYETDIVRVQLA